MITRADVEKLGAMHAVEPAMLSLYLAVPPHPGPFSPLAESLLAEPLLADRADELIAAAEAACGAGRAVAPQDRDAVREQLATCARDWPGRTVAIFACADAGLLAAYPLPGQPRERAVLGIRPHVRPLLAALQRRPGQEDFTLPRESPVAVGLPACLAAVNACTVQTLVVPEDGLVPGYECGRCGALSTDADGCPDWGTAPLPVPDVIEEMVARALEDGAQVWVIRGAYSPISARLHSPVAVAA